MVQRDDRRGLGEAVALDDDEAQAPPELLESGGSGAAPTTNAQNFRPNAGGRAGSATSAPGSTCPCGGASAASGIDAQRVLAQHVEDLRHADDHRDAPALDQAHDVVRVEAAHEDHRAVDHRRDVGGHRLPEHVAERQQVQEAQRLRTAARTSGTSSTSRSTGTMLASTLRWRMTTPLGSAVAPDVKMICVMSSRVDRRRPASARRPSSRGRRAARRGRRGRRHLRVASTSSPTSTITRASTMPRTLRDELGRRAVVDRDDDRRRRAGSPSSRRSTRGGSRPRRRPCRLSLHRARQPRRKAARRAGDIRVGVPPHAVAVVVDEELAAALFQRPEEVDQRRHARILFGFADTRRSFISIT